jgi:4-carboxymuconolactone decarboxylase
MSEKFDTGLKIRREVLGVKYVDASLANLTDFMRPIQKYTTEVCWGTVWSRDDLDRKTRSLLNLKINAAMKRPHEPALYIRGAFNNYVTKAEIGEVFPETAVYCSSPATLDSFNAAKIF